MAEIEKLIREQGTTPFNVNKKIDNTKISDKELEQFLAWRREVRESGVKGLAIISES